MSAALTKNRIANALHNRYLQRAMLVMWIMAVAFIVYLGLKPSPMKVPAPVDKLIHLCSCATVMMLPALLTRKLSFLLICVAMLVLAGVGIEIYQSFLPARQASVEDLIANVVGIMLGLCVGRLIRRLYHSHH